MQIDIRPARAADIPFLAWVQQEAARSHLPRGFWDLAFPGADADRLRIVGRIAAAAAPLGAATPSLCHWAGFLVAEADGQAAAALCGYTRPSVAAGEAFMAAMDAAFTAEAWNDQQRQDVFTRIAPFMQCLPDTAEEDWIIEWVATRPERRGRGLVRALLQAVLERGRARGHRQAQISVLIGNTPAQRAYESAGFRVADEKTHPDFERALGCPGIRRLLRPASD